MTKGEHISEEDSKPGESLQSLYGWSFRGLLIERTSDGKLKQKEEDEQQA
ncbi:hypothetical protein HanXRQr2_Chr17g0778811 [Helianthus annuus]|uniref:Uncharacterized protein n=1 Tax=Helianthus annuus TaxID=4232 RepID=A0A9K3DGB9_HELAN|nr:hypothetical protein HanXRQr2_Chr17g0778811 [Helianthus annuus]KAJ0811123.1 hypothetical protein HanPSC8_Chr17g0747221 [Helianthus annuus]